MKFAICLPVYKFMEDKPICSLLAMISDIYNKDDKIDLVFAHSIGVALARNLMFEQAIKTDADYILSLDCDHIYRASALYALVDQMEKNNLQMLSAAYNARGQFDYYAHLKLGEKGKTKIPILPKGTGIYECDAVGMGFCLFKREFVKMLSEKYKPLFRFADDTYSGEDVYLCQLVKQEGHKVCFDADIKVGHLSAMVL